VLFSHLHVEHRFVDFVQTGARELTFTAVIERYIMRYMRYIHEGMRKCIFFATLSFGKNIIFNYTTPLGAR
jgi:hypothetical protein